MFQNPDFKKGLQNAGIFFLATAIISFLLPFLALTFLKGAEDPQLLDKVVAFGSLGGKFSTALAFMCLIGALVFKFKWQKKLGWIGALINNYEYGLLSEFKVFDFFKSALNRILVFFPMFIIFGYLGITQTGIPFAEQQIVPSGKVIIGIEPAGTEIHILGFIISLLFFIFLYLSTKKFTKKKDPNFWFYIMPLLLLIGTLFGLAIHNLRYGGSDADLFAVGIFWFTATLFMLLEGGIILAWLLKDINNFFQAIKELALSSDAVLFLVIWVFGSIYIILWLIRIYLWTKRKSPAQSG